MGILLTAALHNIGSHQRRGTGAAGAPIVIGAGSWLGARSIVLPGVSIGEGCIVGAGSVVTCDCEPDGIYVWAPARRTRDLLV